MKTVAPRTAADVENAMATMLGLPSDGAADYVDVLR